jgi:hypothetical protein
MTNKTIYVPDAPNVKFYHYTYIISHLETNKHYIGVRTSKVDPNLDLGVKYFSSSTDRQFKAELRKNPTAFKFQIIEIWGSRKDALLHEIDLHALYEVGISPEFYNIRRATSSGFDMLGAKHSDAARTKISAAHKGRALSIEHRAKISAASKGRALSIEHRAKISAAHKGKKRSEEHSAKIAAALKNPSQETRAKISAAQRGKKLSEQARQNISVASKGKSKSEAHREAMRKPKTEEHIKNSQAAMAKNRLARLEAQMATTTHIE